MVNFAIYYRLFIHLTQIIQLPFKKYHFLSLQKSVPFLKSVFRLCPEILRRLIISFLDILLALIYSIAIH